VSGENTRAVRPEAQDIAVPPFAPGTVWIGTEPPAVERICARGPLLVHFIDIAHFSSVRTLPYLTAWCERYGGRGLTVLAVNSPRFAFTGDRGKLAAATARLELPFPVAADSSYTAWHDYGCEGWPSLFLWGRGGALRWYHFGEGEYAGTEEAIQQELGGTDGLPEILPPLRPADAPGALVARPTEERFPGGSIAVPWSPDAPDASLELSYEAGGAWAAVDGLGALRFSLDGGAERAIEIEAPGAYELAEHVRHEHHRLALRPTPGVSIYSIGFSAGVPA
jgi:hypothetical protein